MADVIPLVKVDAIPFAIFAALIAVLVAAFVKVAEGDALPPRCFLCLRFLPPYAAAGCKAYADPPKCGAGPETYAADPTPSEFPETGPGLMLSPEENPPRIFLDRRLDPNLTAPKCPFLVPYFSTTLV